MILINLLKWKGCEFIMWKVLKSLAWWVVPLEDNTQ